MSINSSTTLHKWLYKATNELTNANITTPRLNCLILLEDHLGKDRSILLAHPEIVLGQPEIETLDNAIKRLANGEPMAYIRGHASFYGRTFSVDSRVMVPRPESEVIIDELLKLNLPPDCVISDIGTGSGVLGITAALLLPNYRVELYDISPDALDVAQKNSKQYKLNLIIKKSNLLSDIEHSPNVVLANLPYVPLNYQVSTAVHSEPSLAIFGGNDGMLKYTDFWKSFLDIKPLPGYVLTESLKSQHAAQESLARKIGYNLYSTNGLIQTFSTSP